MIDVEIRIAHALRPRHLSPHCVRREFALVSTKSVKQGSKFRKVRNKLNRRGASLILIISGRVLKPWGQGIGAQRATCFSTARLKRLVDGLVYFSPSEARRESLMWQIIWWADILPQRG